MTLISQESKVARRGALLASWVALWLITFAASAGAQTRELKHDLRVDIPVTVGAGVLWIGSEALKPHLAPTRCRWCETGEPNGFDGAVRSALRWHDIDTADITSSVIGFGFAPVTAFGMLALVQDHDDALPHWPVDATLVLEATMIAADLNQLVKFTVGRERPFVHALPPDEKQTVAHPADNNLSFYSGHTNLAFALAVSSGTVASLRGYRWAPWVWGTGLTLAAATGYLRLAADRHYATDVLAGAALGSAIGFAIPYFFHPRTASHDGFSFELMPLRSGVLVTASFSQQE